MSKKEEKVPSFDLKEEPNPTKEVQLKPEEELLKERAAANDKVIRACVEEINTVLNKYQAVLVVNPQSPISNPQVSVKLK